MRLRRAVHLHGLTAGEDELGVTVSLTSVDGDDLKYDIQVDDQVR